MRKKYVLLFMFLLGSMPVIAQTNPAITSWLINTTNIMGRHYVKGNSTPINDNVLANVQKVQYSATSVYISTKGIPAYITGPFLDGNPSLASDQNTSFKIPLNPVKNTGTSTSTTPGNIGIFINGVALFDYRDGVSWQNSSNSLKGGPIMGMGDNVWNRDAVVGERLGFDCAKAHPAKGNYHHHQNPSAFNLDLKVISNVCDLYAADGLYAIDETKHSPLIGFAYDGFPIYGAYAYKNTDGTGGIVRMKSSYVLRNITTRTTYSNGNSVTPGPAVSTTYPLGYFREDYQYNATSSATPDYLDEHNGRYCITPEYPNGIYCYFATVDENWNSAYPYIVGPTFYGVKSVVQNPTISESVTNYIKSLTLAISTVELLLGSAANSSKTFDITSNTDWTVSSDQTWLSVSKSSGNGNETIIASAQENSSVSSRTAFITVVGIGASTKTIAVTQEGIAPTLAVSTNNLTIASPANSTKTFDITSNVQWTVTSNQTWLVPSKLSGLGNESIVLTAQENSNLSSRSATITVLGTGTSTQLITVIQDGTGPTLYISKDTLTIGASAGSKISFDVMSNTDWTVSSSQNWLTSSISANKGDATIILTAQENPDTVRRIASVIVSASGVSSHNVTVIQEPQKPISVAENNLTQTKISIFPNPASDAVAIQIHSINYENIDVELFDFNGKFLKKTTLFQGSTIAFFDTKTLYNGEYLIRISIGSNAISKTFILNK